MDRCWVHSSVNVLNVRAVYLNWLKVDLCYLAFSAMEKKCVQKKNLLPADVTLNLLLVKHLLGITVLKSI